MKTTLHILGIVIIFSLFGYLLTYPYELYYHGNDEIVLLEDSYKDSTFQQLIGRDEFKNKVLYIKIWEPFEQEVIPYTQSELEKLRIKRDSLRKVNDSTYELEHLDLMINGVFVQTAEIEDHLKYYFEVMEDYKKRDVEFIHIAKPDSDTKTRTDDLRKWKAAIKKFKISGFHLVMNPELSEKVRGKIMEITKFNYLPQYLLVDKHGRIVIGGAPSPDNKSLLYPQLDSLLKTNN